MIPSLAYIIRISSEISSTYADVCARSCDDVGLPYKFFDGVENRSSYDVWTNSGLDIKPGSMDHRRRQTGVDPAACCSVSHALIWKEISQRNECAVILEHDAIMLHPIGIDIPDNRIVVLGYKLANPERYNHVMAGPPTKLTDVHYHHGAHAYVITPEMARTLLLELETFGGGGPIDNRFFLHGKSSKTQLAILDPTPAIGWIRKSTIWSEANHTIGSTIASFQNHLK
jgi:GR25 family glycosyltransferase involved in LPS biosynthesis